MDLRDGDGDTPLLVCEHPDVFEILVGAGADPNVINSAGFGIFKIAVDDENELLANYLISRGLAPDSASVNISFSEHMASGGVATITEEEGDENIEMDGQDGQ